MKKQALFLFTIFMVVLLSCFMVSASDDIAVYYDSQQIDFDVQPQLVDGRTLVPMRAIFEKIGASVEWDGTTETIIATKGEIEIEMKIGSNVLLKNGKEKLLDVPAQIIGTRTLVPVRAVSEALGVQVFWSEEANAVTIYPRGKHVNKVSIINAVGTETSCDYILLKRCQERGWILKSDSKIMYAMDGRTIYIPKSEVEAYKAVCWYETKEEVTQTLYSKNGSIVVNKSEIDWHLQQGWSLTPPPIKYTDKVSFEENSVNGIKLNWWVENTSGKTINYYNVKVYFINPVGDPAYDEITHLPYKTLKYVGPVGPGGQLGIYTIVGYVPTCNMVLIGEVNLEYADGTTESVWCGQVAKEGNILTKWDGTIISR